MRDLELKASWKIIKGAECFFNVTKRIHNALQGMHLQLTDEEQEIYKQYNKMNSESLSLDADYVVIHDPQPAALIEFITKRIGKWIWRCHIDLSQPNEKTLDFIAPYIENYDASIFSMKQYVKESLGLQKTMIIPPSIDPLSNKNRTLKKSEILSILGKYDVDPEKPIITQVSRFDPWKDPLGVIDVYRSVKRKINNVQLLLIASMASDDPEGWAYYEKTARYAGEDYNIHLLTDLIGVRDVEVNAFQSSTNVAIQKSLREGFGLSVTEALWKGIPVVGGNVGGITLQVINGLNGFLVNTKAEAVTKIIALLKNPEKAKKMGERGRKHVRKNFLITRHLKDYLKLFNNLIT
jgi:trehalose synthase